MTLYSTEWSIVSDITPEWAARMPRGGTDIWRLSWLHDRLLTREEALIGMELDELLSDPDGVDDRDHMAAVDELADRLGLTREHVVLLLAERVLARNRHADMVPPPTVVTTQASARG